MDGMATLPFFLIRTTQPATPFYFLFLPGTENPAELALRLETAVIKDGKNAGGAFAIHQTWIHDVKSFEALPEHEQVF
jgi:deferrochelatase/peroxidase EfeB